jgi:protein-tyrosine-phosphatase/predicted ATP-grasp superfamily ATP-dependent carboligase
MNQQMMNEKKRLLIIGASNKSTRSISKSLQNYCETYVLNDADLAVSKSKYVHKYLIRPQVQLSIEHFQKEIVSTINEFKIDLILPSTDNAVDVVMHFRPELEKLVKIIGLNESEAYEYAHSKYKLLCEAKKSDIKVPEFIYTDITSLSNVPENLEFPVVVKPVSSAMIVDNRHINFKVSFPKNREELIDTLRELVPSTPVMIQQYVSGYGIGYNVFCINGKVVSEYIHQRLRENSGVSSYRRIVPINTFSLKEKVHQLLQKSGWNGVAMVEFRVDENGTPFLMEMNGRFFGSTELGVKAGYDFPFFLYSTQFLKAPEIRNNTGKFYSLRLLHDEVLLEYADLFKTFNLLKFFRWKLSLFNLLLPGNYLEDNLFDDPEFVINLYKCDLKRIGQKRKRKKEVRNIPIKALRREVFAKSKNIVFICKGNICRSPFAAKYAKQMFPEKDIISAGTVQLRKRLSPVNAVIQAKKLGADISTHSSIHIFDIDEKGTDLFIVMDRSNYLELKEIGVNEEKIYFLCGHEIGDPYRKSAEVFKKVYLQIKECIDKLV